MIREFDHNQHSAYLLYYHLIMVVKYRKKVIDDVISNRLCEIFTNIGHNYGKMLFVHKFLSNHYWWCDN